MMLRIGSLGVTCAVLILCLTTGCNIGNTSGTCSSGETCECDQIGNCEYSCPDGDCHFRCKGTGNCLFECEGGGCDLVCENTGNCIMNCPGDDCAITCKGTGNCILNKCTSGCGADSGPERDQLVPSKDQRAPDGAVPPDDAAADGPVTTKDGCVPSTCAQLGKNCGQVDDGCGNTISCGTCTTGTCGGGGTQGVCGCPTTTTTTPASPLGGKNMATAGVAAWVSPTNIFTPNAGVGTVPSGVARVHLDQTHSLSQYLVASDFGLAIPAGSVINGIEVDIRRRSGASGSDIVDHEVRLQHGAVLLPVNRAPLKNPWSTNWIYASYGGATDLWGRVWTPAQLNDPSFGVALAVAWNGSSGDDDAFVDHVRVIIHYATSCQCTPATCASKGYNCGTHSDGCGGTISCGTCSTGTCVNGKCCTPDTCAGKGYECGTHSDGCGGTISCGTCSTGACVNGKCCTPDTCAGKGLSCGTHPDGCGGTMDCGTCAPGDACTLGVCGCKDGAKNGSETDVDCGGVCVQECAQGQTCGTGADCATGSCADGVCCDSSCTGFCRACVSTTTGAATGTCADVTTGTDPDNECAAQLPATCGTTGMCGSGACALHPAGTECAPASCAGGVEQKADTCNGAGACTDNGTVACVAPYVCATTTCQSCSDGVKNGNETDVDCGGGGSCSKCAVGKVCTQPTDCASNFCVDGVCCSTACTQAELCKRCDLPGTVGTCAYIEGSDPDNECTAAKKVCSGGSCI